MVTQIQIFFAMRNIFHVSFEVKTFLPHLALFAGDEWGWGITRYATRHAYYVTLIQVQ